MQIAIIGSCASDSNALEGGALSADENPLHFDVHSPVSVDILESVAVVLVSPSAWIDAFSADFERMDSDGVPRLSLAGSQRLFATLRSWRETLRPWVQGGGVLLIDTSGPDRISAHTVEKIVTVSIAAWLSAGPHFSSAALLSDDEIRIVTGHPFRGLLEPLLGDLRPACAMVGYTGQPLIVVAQHCTGLQISQGLGHLLYLPWPAQHWARGLDAVAAFAAALSRGRYPRLPYWVDRVVSPDDRCVVRETEAIARAAAELAERRRVNHTDVARARWRRRVIYSAGRTLWESVIELFAASGCELVQGDGERADLTARWRDRECSMRICEDDGDLERALATGQQGNVLVLADRQAIEPGTRYRAEELEHLSGRARRAGMTIVTTLELYALHMSPVMNITQVFEDRWSRAVGMDWQAFLISE